MIFTSAYKSPGVPRGFGIPSPRNRNRRPVDDPGGTRTFASPPGVTTETVAPSAPSHGAKSRSTEMSRPLTR
jgi:hypothetical protein